MDKNYKFNCGVENVYMFTDCEKIKDECIDKEIYIIEKSKNFDDEFTYLEALRYAYYSLNTKYDIIVSIMCNSVGHNLFSIENAVKKIQFDKDIVEVRGFNMHGNQSGLFVFKADRLPEKWHHMGSVFDAGREIHFKEEL